MDRLYHRRQEQRRSPLEGAGHWRGASAAVDRERRVLHRVVRRQGIVLARGAGASLRGSSVAHDAYFDLILVPAAGGAASYVTRVVGRTLPNRSQFVRPTFAADGRIYFPQMTIAETRGAPQPTKLMSVARDGSDPRDYLSLPFADELSVTGRQMGGLNEGDNVYVVPLPADGRAGQAVDLEKKRGSMPVTQIAGRRLYPHWRDNATVEFGSGARYIAYNVTTKTLTPRRST